MQQQDNIVPDPKDRSVSREIYREVGQTWPPEGMMLKLDVGGNIGGSLNPDSGETRVATPSWTLKQLIVAPGNHPKASNGSQQSATRFTLIAPRAGNLIWISWKAPRHLPHKHFQ